MRDRLAGLIAAAFAVAAAAPPAHAAGTYDRGAGDGAITLGQTYSYGGPGSGASPGAREMLGYFAWLNDAGGINGRKVELRSVDDGYVPPRTVEQTRKLVEADGVLAIFGSLGTPTGEAVITRRRPPGGRRDASSSGRPRAC